MSQTQRVIFAACWFENFIAAPVGKFFATFLDVWELSNIQVVLLHKLFKFLEIISERWSNLNISLI